MDKLAPSSRHAFVSAGSTVYEWTQTVHDVDIFVPLPPGVRAKMLYVDISRSHLKLGITPNPPNVFHAEYAECLQEDLHGEAITSESTWTIEDGELHISLQKATPGEHWKGAFAGHAVNDISSEEDKKRLMLERFQIEHPGFDFSDAQFSGEVPDANTFMGGFSKT